jgi:hypothetical protein
MRKWQNKLNNENKTNKITTDLLNNRTGNTVEMIIKNVLTQHTVVIVARINVYEMFAKQYNITTDSYHADNGAFRSEIFQKSIDNNNQKLNFSGVNAQWQNGLVERSNGTICAAAQSMLNHTISRWDKTITAELWPFSIQHAATIYNTTKRGSRDYDLSLWEQSLLKIGLHGMGSQDETRITTISCYAG